MIAALVAGLASEPERVQPADPFTTVGAVALGLLLLVYVAGVPATMAIAALYWRQRTRRPAPPVAAATAGPVPVFAPDPAVSPPTAVAGAGSSGEAFLHVQRMERDVLALRDAPAPAHHYSRLAVEIADLANRHGSDPMVARHATGLLAIVEALAPLHVVGLPGNEPPSVPVAPPPQVPDRLRVGLARLAAAGRPIPASWAVAWHGHRPDRWPADADRRRDELVAAFIRRYNRTFPHGGMIVVLTNARLTLRYTPVSARFGGRAIDVPTDLPDVTDLPDAVRRLRSVADAALADLRPPITN